MGGKLTKHKNVSMSEKTKEQQKEIDTVTESTDKPVDIPRNEENKQKTKKNKMKKEQKLTTKSSESTVDKGVNTENCVLPSTPLTEQLVGDPVSTINNNISLDATAAQINAAYQPETPNKDLIQEYQNSDLSSEINIDNQHILNEEEYKTDNTSATVVTKHDLVHNDE